MYVYMYGLTNYSN